MGCTRRWDMLPRRGGPKESGFYFAMVGDWRGMPAVYKVADIRRHNDDN